MYKGDSANVKVRRRTTWSLCPIAEAIHGPATATTKPVSNAAVTAVDMMERASRGRLDIQ